MSDRRISELGWLALPEAPADGSSPSWPELGRVILPLLVSVAALLALFDLGRAPRAAVAILVAAFVAWGWAAHCLGGRTLRPAQLLGVAAALRLLLLPLPPTLSDDLLRYAWDGKVVLAGFDPYTLPPEAPELAPLRDGLWRKMPHQHVPSVYPPLAMCFFALAAATPFPLLALKVLFAGADLAACAALIGLAGAFRVPTGRVLLYAWNPLVVLEVAGMGHVDALMVAATVTAVLLLARGVDGRAGLAAAAAVGAKLLPLVVLPLWWRRAGRPWVFGTAAVAGLLLMLAPWALLVSGMPPGLAIYGVSWEWNGPLFEPLWRLYQWVEAPGLAKEGIAGLVAGGWLGESSAARIYPLIYPQFLAKATLAALFALLLAAIWRRRPAPALAVEAALGALLLCMATVYPWYLLVLLPWAALAWRRSWLLLSFTLIFSYLPQRVPGLALFPVIYSLVWLPFFAALLLTWHYRPR